MKHRNKYYNEKVLTAEIPLQDGKRETIIQWLYDCHLVEWYSTYLLRLPLSGKDMMDKIQELYLMICEVPQSKWDSLYEQGKFSISAYVTGIIHQQLISTTSSTYKRYNRYRKNEITQDENFWIINEESDEEE